ncbi:MAG: ABC transporter ATP-binding protein [Clostridiales bacterium]|nr:ABC transporter ATP-binding protein [Clostridiales bacterium]
MSHHRLETKNLYFTYPDGHEALKDISFTIFHGESVGIVGANGAGKSTLLMLLMGVLFPDKGEVLVGDVHVTPKTLPMLRQRLGMVFQNPDDQLFMTTVYEDVAFGPRNYRMNEEEVKSRVMAALETVGMTHLKDRPPYRLSGGEKRAAAIATVLSMQPDVLLMDEPTSDLDPKARRRVIEMLKAFSHTRIITTHDLDMVLDVCQRVIIIREGRIAADGPASSILGDEELLDGCGLELPLAMKGCPVCRKSPIIVRNEEL